MNTAADTGSRPESPVESLTGALVEATDQLLALYELAKVTADSLDANASVGVILSQATRLFGASAMELHVVDDVIVGPSGDRLDPDYGSTSPADSRTSLPVASTTSAVVASVSVSNAAGLEATLIAHRRDRPFGTADHKLLSAVANMALGALHISRLHEDAVAQAVISRDHDTASDLAVRALPDWRPSVDGVELFARSDPARSAGGDLYTFAIVDGVFHFVVGDVSGKGLPAAMMMTNVISASLAAFQSEGRRGPVHVLSAIDSWMYDYLSDAGLFVTLVCGAFDRRSGQLRLANAGHSPVLFVHNGSAEMIEASVPPIGVLPLQILDDESAHEQSFATEPGDRLVMSSDGFTEQENSSGVMFGDGRLIDAVEGATTPCSELGPRLYDMIEAHAGGAEQSDDRTLVILDVIDVPLRHDQADMTGLT